MLSANKHSVIHSSSKSHLNAKSAPSPKLSHSKPENRHTNQSAQRTASVLHEDVYHEAAAPELEIVTDSSAFDQGWAEYQAATQKMKDLEALSAQLLNSLEELNFAAEAFDGTSRLHTMVSPKAPSPEAEEIAEARRSRRAAAREARRQNEEKKITSMAKPSAASSFHSQPQAEEVSTSPSSAESLATTRASLEALLLRDTAPAIESTTTSHASTTEPKPSSHMSLGPSLTKLSLSGPSLRGPSLLPALASEVDGTIVTTSSSAKEANAKRARIGQRSRMSTGASATSTSSAPSSSQRGLQSSSNQFLKSAGSHDLLTSASELDLALIVKDLLFLESVKKDIRGILRRDPTDSEWAKAVCMDEATFTARLFAGREAKAKMLQSNHRLVLSICSKYNNRGLGVSLQDLVTEGIQGLLKGVEKFDPTKGFKFSTYAHWWIRQAVSRSLSDQSRPVRVPGHLYEAYMKMQATKAQLLIELGREATMAELSKRSGLTSKVIIQVSNLPLQSTSLDAPLGDDSGAATRQDMLEDVRATSEEVLEDVLLKRDLSQMLSELDEKEAGIVKLRFGLVGGDCSEAPEVTLKDIGAKYNVTRERIRQIEAKAVRKLRQKHRASNSILSDYASDHVSHELVMRRSQGTNKTK